MGYLEPVQHKCVPVEFKHTEGKYFDLILLEEKKNHHASRVTQSRVVSS